MKVCPVCRSRCFDDMKVCYGCLYEFKNDANSEYFHEKNFPSSNTNKLKDVKIVDICSNARLPEYFEMETSPYIEAYDIFENYTQERKETNNKKSSKPFEIVLNRNIVSGTDEINLKLRLV